MFQITSVYAALIAFLYIALTFRVIAYRRRNQISLGANEDLALETRMRAHGNCAEYAPLGLILLALVESTGAPAIAIHALGLMLIVGRIMHGIGFWGDNPIMRLRIWGMLLTLFMILFAALGLLAHGMF